MILSTIALMLATQAAPNHAAAATPSNAAPAAGLRTGLEPMAFLAGHCWRGEIAPGRHDTHCFEPAYGGQHLRDRHVVTGGPRPYSGETLYSVTPDGVRYTYFNSIGGVSEGGMRPDGDRLDFGIDEYAGPDGRRVTITTHWRRVGPDAYDAVMASSLAAMNRTTRFTRVVEPIAITAVQDPDGTHRLVHETVVAAAPAAVWDAISTAAGWRSWAVREAWLEGDRLETSYSANAARGGPQTIEQHILARLPGRLLVFRTTRAPRGFPDFATFSRTTHFLELEPVGEGRTRVRLTGAGYADTESGRQLLGFFREGNRVSLERLRRRFIEGPINWASEG
jgi:uncharacterized protein YndB with AHSA1/START domain